MEAKNNKTVRLIDLKEDYRNRGKELHAESDFEAAIERAVFLNQRNTRRKRFKHFRYCTSLCKDWFYRTGDPKMGRIALKYAKQARENAEVDSFVERTAAEKVIAEIREGIRFIEEVN